MTRRRGRIPRATSSARRSCCVQPSPALLRGLHLGDLAAHVEAEQPGFAFARAGPVGALVRGRPQIMSRQPSTLKSINSHLPRSSPLIAGSSTRRVAGRPRASSNSDTAGRDEAPSTPPSQASERTYERRASLVMLAVRGPVGALAHAKPRADGCATGSGSDGSRRGPSREPTATVARRLRVGEPRLRSRVTPRCDRRSPRRSTAAAYRTVGLRPIAFAAASIAGRCAAIAANVEGS